MPEDDEINFKNDEDDYSPREENIRAWRKKKKEERDKNKEERRKRMAEIASEIARREVEKEERNEGKTVDNRPFSNSDPTTLQAINTPQPPVPKEPTRRRNRRKHFDQGPTLFDEVE